MGRSDDRELRRRLQKVIEAECAAGTITGGMISVARRDGEVVTVTHGRDGIGRAVTADGLVPLYCAGKPLLALAVGAAVADGELSYEDRLGDLLPDLAPWVADATVDDVLCHRVGLHLLRAGPAVTCGGPARQRYTHHPTRDASFDPATTTAYSEFAGWYLLGEVIEELYGRSYGGVLHETVIEPTGVGADTFVSESGRTFDDVQPRITIDVRPRGETLVPLLLERNESLYAGLNPGFGTLMTTAALARVYASLLGDDGKVPGAGPALADLRRARPRVVHDVILDRPSAFVGGFMVELALHGFIPEDGPDQRFGHIGMEGMAFGYADPLRDAGVAAWFNGATTHETIRADRRTRISAIVADLDPS